MSCILSEEELLEMATKRIARHLRGNNKFVVRDGDRIKITYEIEIGGEMKENVSVDMSKCGLP